MANMAYFNGNGANIGFDGYSIAQGDWKNTFDIVGDGQPVSGSFYPVGDPVRINSSGQVYVLGGTQPDVTGTTNVLDGSLHNVEVTITGTTASIYIDGNSTPEASGTVSTNPTGVGGIGNAYVSGQNYWFKGFIGNYRIYDNTTSLVLDLPLVSDFHDSVTHPSTFVVKPTHVSIFDTADLPYASEVSNSATAKNLGLYYHSGTWYHYWCNENDTLIGSCFHIGDGPLFDRSGCVLNFALPAAIPQNSRITEARLVMTGTADTDHNTAIIPETGAKSKITGWKTATPSAFADWTAYSNIRGIVTGGDSDANLTDNQVIMELGEGESIDYGDVYSSPSLINIIQEIVSLGNISSVALFWDDHDNNSAAGRGYLADYAVYLIVKYDSTAFNCSLTYDANGATGSVPAGGSFEPGHTLNVGSGAGLTYSGYDFAGWATHKDGSGTVIPGGGAFTIQANTVLYAKWARQLTVTYNANGATDGNVPADSNTYNAGESVRIALNTGGLTRTGYTFRSWNTAADGKGVTYLAGREYPIEDSMTLYANWDLAISSSESFFVLTNKMEQQWWAVPVPQAMENPAVGNMDYVTKMGYAIRFVLPYVIPRGTIITSATLAGTGGQEIGISGTLASGTSVVGSIRAHRAPAPASIAGLNDYMDRRGMAADVTVDERNGHLTIAAVDFGGRFITPGAAIDPVSLVPIIQELAGLGDVSSVLLFIDNHDGGSPKNTGYSLALPMQLSYSYNCTVTYNGNGSTGGTMPVDNDSPYAYGDTVTVFGNTGTLTRSGCTFVKWNTKADGTGTDYHAGDEFVIAADTVLYAQWASSLSSDIFFVGYTIAGAQWAQVIIPDMAPNPGIGDVSGAAVTKFGYAVRFVLPAPIPMGAKITSAALKGSAGELFSNLIPEDVDVTYGVGTKCLIHAESNLAPAAITTLDEYKGRRGLVDGGNGTVDESIAHVTTASVPFNDEPITTPGVPFVTGSLVSVLQELADKGDVSSVVLFVDDHEGNSDPNHLYSIAMEQELVYAYGCPVTYNGNGNTGGTAPVDVHKSYTSFDTVTVLGNTGLLTKHGYTFSKWNTAADGSGTDYDPGDTFTITADTILYAQWKVAVSKVVTIVAWDTVNERGKTGDAANIEICGVRDGLEYVPEAPNVTEVNAVRMPGVYTVSLTKMENDCYFNTVGGTSSTTGVVIKPTFWRNEEDGKLLRLLLREILNGH